MATNYNWAVPVVGGSVDAWGTILNAALNGGDSTGAGNSVDEDLQTVETQADAGVADAAAAQSTADAALPADGGVLVTGEITRAEDLSVATSKELDMAVANWFKLTLTGDVTGSGLTAANVPGTAGAVDVMVLDITCATYTISWTGLGTIEWAGGSAPTLNGHDVIALVTYDGGTNWQGAVIQKNLS